MGGAGDEGKGMSETKLPDKVSRAAASANREPKTRRQPLYESIIVPLDGSALGERALPVAAALAARWGAVVRLLRIVGENESSASAAEYLKIVARATGPNAHALPPIVMDDAAKAIRETVGYTVHSLLCMSSHGRGGLGRALLGSVAESVVRESLGPVLLIGPRAGNSTGNTILATFDGSQLSESILPLAVDWADALGMRLSFAHVIAPDSTTQIAGRDVLETNYVESLARRINRPEVAVDWDVLHNKDAGAAIVRYAEDISAAVIAMTTHGRSGLSRIAAGSTAMTVVHRAPCPVLVLRPTPVDSKRNDGH
jgi:nucleotide-binding universal stress UspA family protein